jgi:hypothetical protein
MIFRPKLLRYKPRHLDDKMHVMLPCCQETLGDDDESKNAATVEIGSNDNVEKLPAQPTPIDQNGLSQEWPGARARNDFALTLYKLILGILGLPWTTLRTMTVNWGHVGQGSFANKVKRACTFMALAMRETNPPHCFRRFPGHLELGKSRQPKIGNGKFGWTYRKLRMVIAVTW